MAYIHVKKVGDKNYYTLRISARDSSGKIVTKDLENLGSDISKIKMDYLEKKYKKDIRESYRTINKFLESNYYLEKIKNKKIKHDSFFNKEDFQEIEAARLHYQSKFLKMDKKTIEETYEFFLIKFAVSSTSIEGNTINLSEATRLLNQDISPKNKSFREIYDLQNTKKVFFNLLEKNQELTLDFIRDVHDQLLDKIDERKGYRDHDINILGQPFKPTPARYVKPDMNILMNWYEKNKKMHPLALAIFFHHKFESIHPFSDGNGRTGRILMNHILIKHNYPPFIVLNKERQEYIDAMNQADLALKNNLLSVEMKYYQKLFDFTIRNYKKTYWNTFLL